MTMRQSKTPDSGLDNLHAPKDSELERIVAATLAISRHAIEDWREMLTDDCFTDPLCREIYRAVADNYSAGDDICPSSVYATMRRHGTDIEPYDFYQAVTGGNIVGDPSPEMARLIDLGIRRRIWTTAVDTATRAAAETEPALDLRDSAVESLTSIDTGNDTEATTLADTYRELQGHVYGNIGRDESAITGTPTGFPIIDSHGGLQPTDLIVIGAETSQGKTSLAMAMTLGAIKAGHPVAFYSLEMTPMQLTARLTSMLTLIPSSSMLYDSLTLDHLRRMDESMGTVDKELLHFDGRSTSSIDSICASIRRMKATHGIKGAAVDYLQIVTMEESRYMRPDQAIGGACDKLKRLAKELGIWIIVISQLARDPKDPRPSMSRLRGSGQIEAAADTVILIYRPRDGMGYPEPYCEYATEGTALITVAKGRNTGTYDFLCGFDPTATLFYPLTDDELNAYSNRQSGKSLRATREDRLVSEIFATDTNRF